MNSTENNRVDELAKSLFDKILVPLAEARVAAACPAYFARSAEPGVVSYFEPTSLRIMQATDFEFPGGGDCDDLVDALAHFWLNQGENGLASMTPFLKEIGAALRAEVKVNDGKVDIFCYTMF